MKKAYHTTITTEYGDTKLLLEIGVWDDGEAEIEEAYAIKDAKGGQQFIDVTEWLRTAYHCTVRELPPVPPTSRVKRVKREYTILADYLIDQNAHQLIEDRAGALMDKARDDYEERMAAE